MKKTILTILMIAAAITTAAAQPRAAGIRIGATGLDASYQHTMNSTQFIGADIGLDFGYNANGYSGVKATAIYNFVWARPAWTDKGSWGIYSGPGISLGYVNDIMPYTVGNVTSGYLDGGFLFAIAAQVGLEYTFWFPLQLSLEIRPLFGLHANDGRMRIPELDTTVHYESKVGFYDNGLLGFAPTLTVRYRF